MDCLYLLDSKYENDKSRVVLYFSKDPLSLTHDFVLAERFYPYIITDQQKQLLEVLLTEFKNDIKLESVLEHPENTKLTAKNYEILKACSKIITLSTNSSNTIVIDPDRQFLINNNWSYYDAFCVISRFKIRQIKDYNLIHSAINKYISELKDADKQMVIETLTKRLLLSNLLKTKPDATIKNDQIINILFENHFLKNFFVPKTETRIDYKKHEINLKRTIKMNFSNIWPHLLTNEHNNIGYETINCGCCKPTTIFDTNTLSCSLVEVEFLKDGIYFISKDNDWAKNYHKSMPNQEKREMYKLTNKIRDIPIGPFFRRINCQIPLSDAIALANAGDAKILENSTNHQLSWFCKRKESFVSEIIKSIDRRIKNIEKSINISTDINYSKPTLDSCLNKNPGFLQYITEYSLLNDLLEEIPKFMLNQNTKFYDKSVANAIKSIKIDTFSRINPEDSRLIITENTAHIYENKLANSINSAFLKLNLKPPKLVCNTDNYYNHI